MLREYQVSQVDPLALAHAFGIQMTDIATHMGLSGDHIRRLSSDFRHASRVRRAVLQLALQREQLTEILR
jgi:hypothetical protein